MRASSRPRANPTAPPAKASSELLGKKNAANQGVGGADGFHDADFGAALKNGSRGSGSNGERRGDEARRA